MAARRASRSALAMEARGIALGAKRTITNAPVLTVRDGVFGVGCLGGLIAAIGLAMFE